MITELKSGIEKRRKAGVMSLRALLISIGALLVVLALIGLALGLVEVAKGKNGTWQIWPYYLIHGSVAMVALVLFAIANRDREKAVAVTA